MGMARAGQGRGVTEWMQRGTKPHVLAGMVGSIRPSDK